jgi:hypothetical protein
MKKLLLFGVTLFSFAAAQAQNCSELFFSEYVEGSGNNKALEIYNPTANPITINNDYRIVRYNNGMDAPTANASSQTYVVLGLHTIQPHDVWVISLDKRDPTQPCPGNECALDAALQLVTDTFVCPNYNTSWALYHNGNDAISLQKNVGGNWVYVDIFGEIGVNPGVSWTDAPPLFDDSNGAYYTVDQTLLRKSTVQTGVTTNPSPFIAPDQWDSLPRNTFSNLGFHNCDCNSTGIKENVKSSQVKLFPNPSNGSLITFVSADKNISEVSVYNTLGALVKKVSLTTSSLKVSLDLELAKGVYLTEIIFSDKSKTSESLIVE